MAGLRFRFLNRLQRSDLLPGRLRQHVLASMGIARRAGTFVNSGVTFTTGDVVLMNGAFLNSGVYIDASARVIIGPDVHIGPGCTIITASHVIGVSRLRAGTDTVRPVTIGRGSWIGANVTVLPGTVIAPGCIVAAGSVVKGETLPDGLYAGNPATRIKSLPIDPDCVHRSAPTSQPISAGILPIPV